MEDLICPICFNIIDDPSINLINSIYYFYYIIFQNKQIIILFNGFIIIRVQKWIVFMDLNLDLFLLFN